VSHPLKSLTRQLQSVNQLGGRRCVCHRVPCARTVLSFDIRHHEVVSGGKCSDLLLHFLRDKKFRARGMIYLYSELDRSFFYLRIPNDGGRANFEAVPLTTHLISSEAVAEVRHLCIATCTSTTSRYLTGPLTTNFIINNPAYNFSSRKGLLDD
jgi:hypothetical protein